MLLQVGVKILIQNENGQYLLLQRSPNKYSETHDWDIPGGRIEPGSPLLENLTREVHEETQLTLVGTPQLIAAQDILRIPGRHVVRLTYQGTAKGNIILSDENIAFAWLTVDEMREHPALDRYVREILEKEIL